MWRVRYPCPNTHRQLPCHPLTPSLTPFRVACPFSTSQPVLTPGVANTAQSCGHTSVRRGGGGGVCATHNSPPTWAPAAPDSGNGEAGRGRGPSAARIQANLEQCGRGTGPSLYHGAGDHLPSWSLSLPVSHTRFMGCRFQKTLLWGLGRGAPTDPKQREQLAHGGRGRG